MTAVVTAMVSFLPEKEKGRLYIVYERRENLLAMGKLK